MADTTAPASQGDILYPQDSVPPAPTATPAPAPANADQSGTMFPQVPAAPAGDAAGAAGTDAASPAHAADGSWWPPVHHDGSLDLTGLVKELKADLQAIAQAGPDLHKLTELMNVLEHKLDHVAGSDAAAASAPAEAHHQVQQTADHWP